MDFEQLDELARKLMKKRKSHVEREIGSIYYHGRRVSRLVLELRRLIVPDDDSMDDMLRLAGLFHDVGKGIEPHARYGAAIFREAMRDCDVTPTQVDCAARLIAAHCDRRPSEPVHDTWERLIQDADLLDHIGTYTIWMDFNWCAYREEGVDEARKRLSSIEEYIASNRKGINFPQSLAIYDEKSDFLRAFVARLDWESRGRIGSAGQCPVPLATAE